MFSSYILHLSNLFSLPAHFDRADHWYVICHVAFIPGLWVMECAVFATFVRHFRSIKIFFFLCSFNSGITNIEGKFILYDITVTVNTTFTATYSTVSATCNVYLCEFVDYGVTGNTNSNWVKVSGTDNKTVTSTGTTLANTTTTRYDIFANIGSTSSVYDFTSPFTVEVDIVGYVGTTARLQVYDATNNQTYNGVIGTGHWKIIVDGTTVKPYKDGVEQTNYTRNIQTARIGFYLTQNTTITYKNFVIY